MAAYSGASWFRRPNITIDAPIIMAPPIIMLLPVTRLTAYQVLSSLSVFVVRQPYQKLGRTRCRNNGIPRAKKRMPAPNSMATKIVASPILAIRRLLPLRAFTEMYVMGLVLLNQFLRHYSLGRAPDEIHLGVGGAQSQAGFEYEQHAAV